MTGQCTPNDIRDGAFRHFDRLGRLQDFCEQNNKESIPPRRAAAICVLEPTYFSTYFHEKVGVCYVCWLNHLRVGRVQALFNEQYQAVTHAAAAVSFSSLSSFERAFKRSTGMTANAYRAGIDPS